MRFRRAPAAQRSTVLMCLHCSQDHRDVFVVAVSVSVHGGVEAVLLLGTKKKRQESSV